MGKCARLTKLSRHQQVKLLKMCQQKLIIKFLFIFSEPIRTNIKSVYYLMSDSCRGTDNVVNHIEQVEILITLKATVRGLVKLYLTSPMGTRSQILNVF